MEEIIIFTDELKLFFKELGFFITKKLHLSLLRFEEGKGVFVTALYKQRGKLARKLMHTGMAGLAGVGMMIAPVIAQEFPGRSVNPWEIDSNPSVLSATTESSGIETIVSEKVRDGIKLYKVEEGDTVASIAKKFGVDTETIRWQNSISGDKIKIGQTLEILPVTGIAHKVAKGDTVYSIAKKYDSSAQAVVDFPFNTFSNDETFELAIGQIVIVPDGVKPAETVVLPRIRQITPDAGSVVASGNFVWPANGTISQNFVWYHPGLDIANRGAPNVLAADSGVVTYAGCLNWGYGCHVRIDHGNGYSTLYAHFQQIYVTVGQSVGRGSAIGKMGSTGRSTGTHLHFEVAKNGVKLSPLSVLK
ncbi:MAG: M23 family metallopeptidase [Candidatus Woesebacteria bacterium]|nr:M23 family metallopeptidase [Candidatus Woesebacteria bacterium]